MEVYKTQKNSNFKIFLWIFIKSQNPWSWQAPLEIHLPCSNRMNSDRCPVRFSVTIKRWRVHNFFGHLFLDLTIYTVQIWALTLNNFFLFQPVSIASFSVTGHCWENFNSFIFILSHQLYIHSDKIPLSLFQAKQLQLSLSLNVAYSGPFVIFLSLHWTCLSMSCSYWRAQHWTQPSRYVSLMLSREEESCLDLLVTLLLWPRRLLTFVSKAHCCSDYAQAYSWQALFLLVDILYCTGAGFLTSFVEFHEVPVSPFHHC